jgi:hypothetical protein
VACLVNRRRGVEQLADGFVAGDSVEQGGRPRRGRVGMEPVGIGDPGDEAGDQVLEGAELITLE